MGFLEELFNPKLTAERRLAREGESMNQPVMANQQLPGQGVNVPPQAPPPQMGQNSLSTMPQVPAGMTLAQFQAQQQAEQAKKMAIAKALAAAQAQGGSPGAVAQPMPPAPQKPLRVPYNVPR